MRALVALMLISLPVAVSAQSPAAGAGSGAADSLRIVVAGVRALGGTHATRWRVGAFVRDSAGVTLSVFPPCPARVACAGGGGRVRVRRRGAVVVQERYR